MEVKKTPKADLQNKRGLFILIGLNISLAILIAAFSYSQGERKVEKIENEVIAVEEELIEVTRQDQKPPEPIKQQQVQVLSDFIKVVQNDQKIETEFDFAEFSEDIVVVEQEIVEEEIVEDDAPVLIAEEMPSFQGGDLNTFRNWVQSRLKYPQVALENNVQGQAVMTFVIERDGRLTGIQVLQAPDRSLGDEAARVLAMSPKWKPGKQRNSPVRVKYILPVVFKIQH
ncbi:MAG: energy transducer TonB [Rikenellaceae bacterium]|nr:energy transducer TonB [Rikenellaceae bacterium]MBR2443314.1 energy transducer TonB [Rikenellaceae bacterium]